MTEEEKAAKEKFDTAYAIVKGSPEFNSILKNHGETYLAAKEDELGRTAQGKAWRKVDDAIKEAGYTPKEEGVYTSDYAAQLAKDYLSTKQELEELREGSGKEKTQADKDKDALYESRLAKLNEEREAAISELATEKAKGKRQEISSKLFSGANLVTLNPALTDDGIKAIKQVRIDSVIANSKEVDGKTIYYDADGKEYANTNGMPMTAKEVGKFIFADLAFEKTPGGGADDNSSDNQTNVEGDIWVIPNPTQYKTFAELSAGFEKAMRLIGLTRKDEEYNTKLSATYNHYYKEDLPSGVN